MNRLYLDEYLPIVDSTNRRARELAESGAPHGSGVRADRQSAGRGRLDRNWFSSAAGNLYCSYILRPTIAPERYPCLSMMAGLAVARFIESYAAGLVGLKWPNDVIIAGKKCGGILCESFTAGAESRERFVIVGIGLNLNLATDELPPSLREIATSLTAEGLPLLEPAVVFVALRGLLLEEMADFESHGLHGMLSRWQRFDILAGKRASWVSRGGTIVAGDSLGPGEDGMLRIRDDHGAVHTVISGDIALARRER